MNPQSHACHEIEILLTEYAAGELDPRRNEIVRMHLAGCDECRAELRRELRLRELMGSLPVRRLPLEVGDLEPADRTAPRAAGLLRRWLAPAASVAAVLALVLLSGRLGSDLVPDSGPAPRAEAPAARRWSEQELDRAQEQVEYTLALTARLLRRSEQSAVKEVFGDRLPRAINDSLRKTLSINEGDQG